MIDRKKDKLIHAMAFFVKKTRHCHKLKLFKLLYFLDFEHFRQTGRNVTGLQYFAWRMGPVPTKLYKEMKNPDMLKNLFDFTPQSSIDSDFTNDKAIKILPKVKFDEDFFSKREMEIMNRLMEIYKDTLSRDMTTVSHDIGSPWDRVYRQENKEGDRIPYEYILDDSTDSVSKEEAEEIDREDKEMERMFG